MMKVIIYLPYFDYNDGAFDTDDDYYAEGEYANAIYDDYIRNKDIVENTMNGYKNGRRDVFMTGDNSLYKFSSKRSPEAEKVAYSSCEATLYNDNGDDETVDGLIDKFARQQAFIEMVDFNRDTSEEEFETELSLWSREHNTINSYLSRAGEEWVMKNEPNREIRVKFINKAGEELYASFEKCKIVDNKDPNSWIIYVGKMKLIDKF